MNDYKSKSVLQFMSDQNFSGDPKLLVKKLIIDDLEEVELLGGVDTVKDRLKYLASLRGISEPNFIELSNLESGHTDGSQININSNDSASRQIFTWAHEIVHSYFRPSSGVKVDCLGGEFHCSSENLEEEALCDYGASIILFYGHAPEAFDLVSLNKMISLTGASPEATASSMLQHFDQSHGFIVWKRKLKKGENKAQISMFEGDIERPFRIDYAICENVFLPENKSVDKGDSIDRCELDSTSEGEIVIDLKSNIITLSTQNLLISGGRILTLFKVCPFA